MKLEIDAEVIEAARSKYPHAKTSSKDLATWLLRRYAAGELVDGLAPVSMIARTKARCLDRLVVLMHRDSHSDLSPRDGHPEGADHLQEAIELLEKYRDRFIDDELVAAHEDWTP